MVPLQQVWAENSKKLYNRNRPVPLKRWPFYEVRKAAAESVIWRLIFLITLVKMTHQNKPPESSQLGVIHRALVYGIRRHVSVSMTDENRGVHSQMSYFDHRRWRTQWCFYFNFPDWRYQGAIHNPRLQVGTIQETIPTKSKRYFWPIIFYWMGTFHAQ